MISESLSNIVDEYFVKQQIQFDVFLSKPEYGQALDILNEFLIKSNAKYLSNFGVHLIQNKFRPHYLKNPTLFFVTRSQNIIDMLKYYTFRYPNGIPMKFLIFITNDSFKSIETLWQLFFYEKLTLWTGSIIHHSFFITNDGQSITLSTMEWFVRGCNKLSIEKINIFNKTSGSWIKKLENYEKFMQFNGCELVMLIPLIETYSTFFWGYSRVHNYSSRVDVFGLTPEIFRIASTKFNFIDAYQPARISDGYILPSIENTKFVGYNGIVKEPLVYFDVLGVHAIIDLDYRVFRSFTDIKFDLFATPADAYTPYEKLLLPFDEETWILLVVTFLITFFVIIIINRLSKGAQDIVYGKKIETPIWNVISIFFGISQTKLPTENFSRFILTLFIVFCLIFRTCFQSKSFEFLTDDPRRAPPKTVQDLIDRNYTILTSVEQTFHSFTRSEIQQWYVLSIFYQILFINNNFIIQRPKAHYVDAKNLHYLFSTQSQNSSAKICLIVDEFFHMSLKQQEQRSFEWNQIDASILTSHEGIAMPALSIFTKMIHNVTDRLIDSGIMENMMQNLMIYSRKFQNEKDPKILSLDDLAFGWNIWLGFCGISGLIFVFELVLMQKFCRKLILNGFSINIFKYGKIKHGKIHPSKNSQSLEAYENQILTAKLKDKFKILRHELKVNKNETNIDDGNDIETRLFGEKI